ncbi:C-C motif chemokine 4-like [Huso huso]|uniref:C-C motif chemokine 4-like n=1 Tax=Huso huso TaxID=61971 RepID=A0ABR0Z115_HUSHU
MHHFNNKTFQLALIVIVCGLVLAASDPGKPSSCCKMTRRTKIRTPITAYAIQKEALPCVHAVIFTSNGLKYCSNPTMPWVKKAIEQLQSTQKTQ